MFDFLLAPTASSSNKPAQRFYHPVDELQLLNFVTQDVGLFNAQLGIRRNKFFIPMTLKANLPMDLARAYSSGRNMLIWLRDFAIEKRELLKNHLALSKKQQNKCAKNHALDINALDIKIVAAIDCVMYYFWKVEKYFIENPDLSRLMALVRDEDECEFRLVRSNRAIALEKSIRPTKDKADFSAFFDEVHAVIKASFKETNDVLAIPAGWKTSKKKKQLKAAQPSAQPEVVTESHSSETFLGSADRAFALKTNSANADVQPEADSSAKLEMVNTVYEFFTANGVYCTEGVTDEQKLDFAKISSTIFEASPKDIGTMRKDLNTMFDCALRTAPAEMYNYDGGVLDMAAVLIESGPFGRMVHPVVETNLEALHTAAVLNIARLVVKLLEAYNMKLDSGQIMTLCANDEARLSIGTRVTDLVKTVVEELTKQKIEKISIDQKKFMIEHPAQEEQVSADAAEGQSASAPSVSRRSKKQDQHKV